MQKSTIALILLGLIVALLSTQASAQASDNDASMASAQASDNDNSMSLPTNATDSSDSTDEQMTSDTSDGIEVMVPKSLTQAADASNGISVVVPEGVNASNTVDLSDLSSVSDSTDGMLTSDESDTDTDTDTDTDSDSELEVIDGTGESPLLEFGFAKTYLQSTIRYDYNFTQFLTENGKQTFLDTVSNYLAINESDITIMSMIEGSVIIAFMISDPTDSNNSTQANAYFQGLNSKIQQGVADGGMKIYNATILNYSSNFDKQPATIVAAAASNSNNKAYIIIGALLIGAVLSLAVVYFVYKRKNSGMTSELAPRKKLDSSTTEMPQL